ncbi:hypothetical protein [Argonema galeatum]|uniref:hypothetical protein n=1 Tax=Argonema galeatum TaxID=2942762 RepID=UPI002012918A|nr:hypothetical protein [Argonema galeatum]MCL1464365.1 hypothetical protein [Argonema galeatum A003/A1]
MMLSHLLESTTLPKNNIKYHISSVWGWKGDRFLGMGSAIAFLGMRSAIAFFEGWGMRSRFIFSQRRAIAPPSCPPLFKGG